jgi:hypothetical protein
MKTRYIINKDTPIIGTAESEIEAAIEIARSSTDETYSLRPYIVGKEIDEVFADEIREGSKIILRTKMAEGYEEKEFDSLAKAKEKVETLEDKDGYELIDLEDPKGSAPSKRLADRPSLHE